MVLVAVAKGKVGFSCCSSNNRSGPTYCSLLNNLSPAGFDVNKVGDARVGLVGKLWKLLAVCTSTIYDFLGRA